MSSRKLRIAFIHPDLGIGGAERLVVDAAVGLQKLGHSVDIYTSHHDPGHCFEETRDGTLRVHHVRPPFPRAFRGKLHALFSHARLLHLTAHLLLRRAAAHDVYFVDILPTCVPLLRWGARTRVLYYCHFPDKLMVGGPYVERWQKQPPLLKRLYRLPMDWLEELTTGQADTILVNSNFTRQVFKRHFPTVRTTPRVVYPGIDVDAYAAIEVDKSDPDVQSVLSNRPTLLSINRFESKKNVELAIESYVGFLKKLPSLKGKTSVRNPRLVLAGGYDPRLMDNVQTLQGLVDLAKKHNLSYTITTPSNSTVPLPSIPSSGDTNNPDVLFLLNFSTAQRSALLTAPSTIALLYTPENEHFGIGPVEAMACGLPVLASDTGGPKESIIYEPAEERTGWLYPSFGSVWANALEQIVCMPKEERRKVSERARKRAREHFAIDTMARELEKALQETVAMGPVPFPWVALLLFFALLAYVWRKYA